MESHGGGGEGGGRGRCDNTTTRCFITLYSETKLGPNDEIMAAKQVTFHLFVY